MCDRRGELDWDLGGDAKRLFRPAEYGIIGLDYGIIHIHIIIIPYYPILSHIIPYYPILSHIIPYYPILSHIIPYHPILSHIIPYHPILSHIIPYHPILSHIIPYHPILSHIIPYYPILSHIIPYSSSLFMEEYGIIWDKKLDSSWDLSLLFFRWSSSVHHCWIIGKSPINGGFNFQTQYRNDKNGDVTKRHADLSCVITPGNA